MNKFYPNVVRLCAACIVSTLLVTSTLALPGSGGRTGGKNLFSRTRPAGQAPSSTQPIGQARPGQAPAIGLDGFDGTATTTTAVYTNQPSGTMAANVVSSGFDVTAFGVGGNVTMSVPGGNGYGTPNPSTDANHYVRVQRNAAGETLSEMDVASDDGSAFNLQSVAVFVTETVSTDLSNITITAYRSGVQVGSPVVTSNVGSVNGVPLPWNNITTNFVNIDQIKITVSDATTPGVPATNDIATMGVDALVLVPVTVNNPALSNATVGAAYTSETFTASNGTAPYTFAVTSGALPAGMSLSSGGVLSGTPTAGGTFSFSVTATDATSQTSAADAVSLTVNAPTIALSPATLSDGQYKSAYTSQTFTASGGVAPYTFSATGLPPGMSLSSAGVLSGTPTAAGTYSVSITATDNATGTGPYSKTNLITLVIDKVPLTITANNQTKVYGAALPTLTAGYTGFVGGDNAASLTTAPTITTTATAASSVLGSPYPITASGAVDPNYSISYVAGSLTVTAAPLTVTANNQTKVYGAAFPTLTASYTGFVNGDNASSLTVAPTLSTTATAASPVNTYPITASGVVDLNYTISYVAGSLTVTAAPLTITADNQTKVYGAALPTLTASYTGFVNGDNAASLTTAPTLSTTATAASPVNGYPITASGAVDANYTISYVAGTLTVGQATLTVTANDASKLYGAALPVLSVSYSGFVNGDNAASLTTAPTATTTATAASPVNTYPITASGAVDPNYTFSYVAGTLTISPATLTVTADNQSMTYGAALPALTVTYSGFVNGDNAASLTTAATASTPATSASPVNTYPITPSGAVDPNYTISYVAGTLTISPAALTVIADNQSMAYGAAVPTLTASYSGFVNGDNAASLTTAPTLSTTATSASPVNTYPINASGAVDPNYTITYVAGTLTIGQATLTVTANDASKLYGAALPALSVSYSGFVNGDNASSLTTAPTVTTTATAASPVNGYPITASGAVDPNYTISYVPGTLTVSPATLTVTANDQSMTYGAALPALTVTYSGFVNGDNTASLTTAATASTPATSASPVNTYPITPSGAVDPNYTISYVAGTLTITPAALTVTADNQSMTYGAALPALTVTYSGFVNGDNTASLTTAATASTPATSASPVNTYPITPSGAVDPNYTISYVAGTLTISPAALTITADNQSMAYGAAVPTLTASYTGFVNGDNAASLTTAPTLSTTATSASPQGNYPINVSGAVDPNYTITYVAGTLNIGKAILTVTANDQSMTYGAALPALTLTYSGFVNGDNVASLTTAATVSTPATSASPVGPYTLTASGAVDPNYTIVYVPGTLTINPAALTVTANDQSMTYGAALPALTVTYSGFVNGDNTASLTTAATASTPATAASPVNTYPITPSGAVDPNYTISYVAGTLTITPATLTVTADNQSMTYGAALPALTVTYSGFVNGDNTASLTTAATASTPATSASPVNTYPITPSGAVDPNYTITYVAGTLTISPAALTITADNQSMAYGAAVPTLTASYTGFVNGDNAASLTTAPTLSTTATSASPQGNYPINVSGAVDPNYTITYVAGTLNIGKAILTVTADNVSKTYGAALPALTITYSGFVNGDNASSLTVPAAATTTATAASPAGAYTITASGAVDPNYTIVYVPGTLTINPAALTVTADDQSMTYGGAIPTFTASYSGFVNGDNAASLTTAPTLSTPATSASPAGSYPITASGVVDPNYTISYVTGTLTVSPAALTITADNASMTYGGAIPSLTASYSGFVNGDNAASLTTAPTLSTTATSASPVGSYPITASGAVDPNYTISYAAGVLTVGKAPLTVTADNASMTYGGVVPALTVSYSGFVNGDNAASLTTQATAATTATSASPVGTYTITASGAASGNYTFTYASGTLTIGQAILTITGNDASMTYGGTVPALSASYSGFVNGDNTASLTTLPTLSTTATSTSPAGNYPVTASGAVSTNYTFVYVSGTLTIGQATLTATAANASMTYGGTVPTLGVTYSGFVNGDNASVVTTAATVTTPATSASGAGTYPITASGAIASNYTFAYVPGTLTIGQAVLTAQANDQTRYYLEPNPPLTVTYSGFVNGDDASVVTTPATATTTAVLTSPAGMYPITPSGAAAANYTFTYVDGTLTIIQLLPNVITFGILPGKIYGDADFIISATATSGLPVTLASENSAIATVTQNGSGNWVVHIVSAGQVTISATQAGNATYAGAAEVDQTLVIGQATQFILFPYPLTSVPTTGQTINLGATASSGLPITYTVSDPTLATVSANHLTITGSGSFTVTASQPGNIDYTAASPVTISLQTFDQRGFVDGIGVFPNPAHGTLHVRMNQGYIITKIAMFDLQGKVVLGLDQFQTGADDIPLNVSSLMPGIYILRVVCIRNNQLVYPNFMIEIQ